mgnify:CR=1 FL=1
MQWTDDGIIIGTRRHGETSLIVELMTPAHGRHPALVRGGRSRRLQRVLQPGHSEVMPGETDICTRIAGDIDLNVPILSAAMDTVT